MLIPRQSTVQHGQFAGSRLASEFSRMPVYVEGPFIRAMTDGKLEIIARDVAVIKDMLSDLPPHVAESIMSQLGNVESNAYICITIDQGDGATALAGGEHTFRMKIEVGGRSICAFFDATEIASRLGLNSGDIAAGYMVTRISDGVLVGASANLSEYVGTNYFLGDKPTMENYKAWGKWKWIFDNMPEGGVFFGKGIRAFEEAMLNRGKRCRGMTAGDTMQVYMRVGDYLVGIYLDMNNGKNALINRIAGALMLQPATQTESFRHNALDMLFPLNGRAIGYMSAFNNSIIGNNPFAPSAWLAGWLIAMIITPTAPVHAGGVPEFSTTWTRENSTSCVENAGNIWFLEHWPHMLHWNSKYKVSCPIDGQCMLRADGVWNTAIAGAMPSTFNHAGRLALASVSISLHPPALQAWVAGRNAIANMECASCRNTVQNSAKQRASAKTNISTETKKRQRNITSGVTRIPVADNARTRSAVSNACTGKNKIKPALTATTDKNNLHNTAPEVVHIPVADNTRADRISAEGGVQNPFISGKILEAEASQPYSVGLQIYGIVGLPAKVLMTAELNQSKPHKTRAQKITAATANDHAGNMQVNKHARTGMKKPNLGSLGKLPTFIKKLIESISGRKKPKHNER